MTIAMFVLSSVYWVVSVYDTFISINLWRSQFDHVRRKPLDWLQITDALPLVNVSVHYKSRSYTSIREYP